jgi:membrane protein required for beta-lactamase induction
VNPRRLIPTLYIVILAVLGVGAGEVFFEMREVYNKLKHDEAASRQRLAEAQTRLAEQQRILERLRTDHEFVEKVIRKQGFAKSTDWVFKFED